MLVSLRVIYVQLDLRQTESSNSCCVGEPGAATRDRVVPGVESRELELTDEVEVAVLGSSLRIPMSGLLTCTL